METIARLDLEPNELKLLTLYIGIAGYVMDDDDDRVKEGIKLAKLLPNRRKMELELVEKILKLGNEVFKGET